MTQTLNYKLKTNNIRKKILRFSGSKTNVSLKNKNKNVSSKSLSGASKTTQGETVTPPSPPYCPLPLYLQLLPPVLQVLNLGADGVVSKVPLLDHVLACGAHILDARLMAGQLCLQCLMLLHQVLYANQVTSCNACIYIH